MNLNNINIVRPIAKGVFWGAAIGSTLASLALISGHENGCMSKLNQIANQNLRGKEFDNGYLTHCMKSPAMLISEGIIGGVGYGAIIGLIVGVAREALRLYPFEIVFVWE